MGDRLSGLAEIDEQPPRFEARKQELARKHVGEPLAQFFRAIGLDTLEAKRRGLFRDAGIGSTRNDQGL
ncbi:MAG TPA: hypothetical protein VFA57_12810 [Pseudolabrys sp.]|nr:hypothetical protein [Pseudolabrys sp.]